MSVWFNNVASFMLLCIQNDYGTWNLQLHPLTLSCQHNMDYEREECYLREVCSASFLDYIVCCLFCDTCCYVNMHVLSIRSMK